MKALVTGGGGFIGSWTVRTLLEEGIETRVAEPPGADLSNLEGLRVETAEADVRDAAALRRAAEGCRWVFHLAAYSRFWAKERKVFEEVNVGGAANLFSAARAAGVERVVHVSSATILRIPKKGSGDERDLLGEKELKDPYEKSKLAAERLALKAARADLDVVVASPTVPVGPGEVHLTPPGRMIVDFARGKIPAYMNSGFNVADVRDVARGVVLAAKKGQKAERYILGGRNVSQKEFFHILAGLTGKKPPRMRIPYALALAAAHASELISDRVTGREPMAPLGGVRASRRHFYFDHGKAFRDLGYAPRFSLEESLRDALAWSRERGVLPAEEG